MDTYLFARASDTAFLIGEADDGVFLYSIKSGVYTCDTWHPNLEEAKAQAAYNVRQIVGPWQTVTMEFGDKLKRGEVTE